MADSTAQEPSLSRLTAQIVSAYLRNNQCPVADLPKLIETVHQCLSDFAPPPSNNETEETKYTPAVAIRKSIQPDHLVCLEDGAKLKMLKRYLRTHYKMTPEQYRQKWNLPHDYPMVAPNYSKSRSDVARAIGLGRKRKNAV
jgi:predicted transcriptional regulator